MTWTLTDIITIIFAIGSVVTSVIAAIKGTAAQAQSAAQQNTLNSMSARLDSHGEQLNSLNANMLPPSLLPMALQQASQPVQPAPAQQVQIPVYIPTPIPAAPVIASPPSPNTTDVPNLTFQAGGQ